ncbi:MarR family winged helix-turn-helix transcriptional regulator [Microbacterium xanthum]|uniref:MarR family winged helix-turn-helix transcriptional regulator n=1 Tax=Microbacterium xanthum TaxID=3079794 RepID=UPI002AD42DB0|nr:MarR family winged helix-turn-helix transcriptional regulator [Microbacterium sp. KSW-48]MDZ8172997.1 MarR family winged helix-turn-helix transcriptional regulator [Microbacterium sp. KSW-48]
MSEPRADDPAAAIAAALARLRGRRVPRPPWEGGRHPHGKPGVGERGRPEWPGARPFGGPHGGARFGGPARVRMLDVLAGAPDPLSVSELAERIGVDQPRASRLVQQGVQAGMVRREADPDDARRTRIALTDDGAAIARSVRGERTDAVRTALADFTDAERAELARLLGKLADAWPDAEGNPRA